MSGHDISDGGLITCAVEMAISGLCGINIHLSDKLSDFGSAVEIMFNEECGWIVECAKNDTDDILKRYRAAGVPCFILGETGSTGMEATVKICINKSVQ